MPSRDFIHKAIRFALCLGMVCVRWMPLLAQKATVRETADRESRVSCVIFRPGGQPLAVASDPDKPASWIWPTVSSTRSLPTRAKPNRPFAR
jgi:hypothetical protein